MKYDWVFAHITYGVYGIRDAQLMYREVFAPKNEVNIRPTKPSTATSRLCLQVTTILASWRSGKLWASCEQFYLRHELQLLGIP